MNRTTIAVCACLLLGATSLFAQDRTTQDTQTPNAAANPASNGSPNPSTQINSVKGSDENSAGDTTQNKNAMQSGHQGVEGSQLTRKQCQDMSAQEAKNPNLQRDPAKDKACAQVLSRSSGNSTTKTQ
jgi:hypothetical protein